MLKMKTYFLFFYYYYNSFLFIDLLLTKSEFSVCCKGCLSVGCFCDVSEISTCSGSEEEELGEIWHGWLHHLHSDLYCLVPSTLHVSGQVCGWGDQSAPRCLPSAQHCRIWGSYHSIYLWYPPVCVSLNIMLMFLGMHGKILARGLIFLHLLLLCVGVYF